MIGYIRYKWKYGSVRRNFYNIKWFFKNLWRYKSQLYYGLRPWDSMCGMEMFMENLKDLLVNMKGSDYMQEVDETRIQKEKDITRVIELFENQKEENYSERCGFDYDCEFIFEPLKDKAGLSSVQTTESKKLRASNNKAMKAGYKLEEKEHKELMKLLSNYRSWWI